VDGDTASATPPGVDRRRFVQLAALSGAALLTGCRTSDPLADRQPIRLGYVTPQSGPLFTFGDADSFVIGSAKERFKDGLEIGGRAYPVEILVKDSQSDPVRASEVARQLIDAQVHMMLVSSTPETTNPVADACERAGVPCISTVTPYQPWFLERDPAQNPGDPKPYRWTWHFFWGLEDLISVFADMWGQIENNQVLGGLWPDDGDGKAFSRGFPAALEPQGYEIVDPGRYRNEKDSFQVEIQRFKDAGADIVTGVPVPPDFATFWKQAAKAGYKPKIATLAKAALFPAFLEAIEATSPDTIVGRVDWTSRRADFPNVARTPLVGGQWRPGTTWPFELEIVSNATNPEIPATGTLEPIV